MGYRPFRGCMVKKAADQTAANYSVAAAVSWDTESYDTDSFHNPADDTKLTVPSSGVSKVRVGANLYMSLVTAGSDIQVQVLKDGSSDYAGQVSQSLETSAFTPQLSMSSGAIPVVGGEVFTVLLQNSDTSITLHARSNFWIEIVE